MKVTPPFCMSVTAEFSNKNHHPRSQIDEKFVGAQLNEVVKWSITNGTQYARLGPRPVQGGALLQSAWLFALHIVVFSLCPNPSRGDAFVGIGLGLTTETR